MEHDADETFCADKSGKIFTDHFVVDIAEINVVGHSRFRCNMSIDKSKVKLVQQADLIEEGSVYFSKICQDMNNCSNEEKRQMLEYCKLEEEHLKLKISNQVANKMLKIDNNFGYRNWGNSQDETIVFLIIHRRSSRMLIFCILSWANWI